MNLRFLAMTSFMFKLQAYAVWFCVGVITLVVGFVFL